jgi:hypothetical protein
VIEAVHAPVADAGLALGVDHHLGLPVAQGDRSVSSSRCFNSTSAALHAQAASPLESISWRRAVTLGSSSTLRRPAVGNATALRIGPDRRGSTPRAHGCMLSRDDDARIREPAQRREFAPFAGPGAQRRERARDRARTPDLPGAARGEREDLARRAHLVRGHGQGLRDDRRPSSRRAAPLGLAAGAGGRAGGARPLGSGPLLPAALRRAPRLDRGRARRQAGLARGHRARRGRVPRGRGAPPGRAARRGRSRRRSTSRARPAPGMGLCPERPREPPERGCARRPVAHPGQAPGRAGGGEGRDALIETERSRAAARRRCGGES